LPAKYLSAFSADGRFLLLQNATPATSIQLIDVAAGRAVGEIATPGCYGIIAWPKAPRRLSTLCGDGTLQTIEFSDDGKTGLRSSLRFFDADADPVFSHFEMAGTTALFISFNGALHAIDLGGAAPVAAPAWSLRASGEENWRPGGMQLMAADSASGRLYVGMHAKGAEGSHKSPADEIWIYDLARRKRIGRAPGHGAVALVFAPKPVERLFVVSAQGNRILALAPQENGLAPEPERASQSVGETPAYLMAR
jgi:methylamine dehydrogenase heavy chain